MTHPNKPEPGAQYELPPLPSPQFYMNEWWRDDGESRYVYRGTELTRNDCPPTNTLACFTGDQTRAYGQACAQWQASRAVPSDPCPNCPTGAVCKKPTCGRLKSTAPSDLHAEIMALFYKQGYLHDIRADHWEACKIAYSRALQSAVELVSKVSNMQSLAESAAIINEIEGRRLERAERMGLVANSAPAPEPPAPLGYITEQALEELRAKVNSNPLSIWSIPPPQRNANIPVYLSAQEQPAQEGMTDERKAAEHEYSISAFNFERDPIGSNQWMMFWDGWKARALLASQSVASEQAKQEGPVAGRTDAEWLAKLRKDLLLSNIFAYWTLTRDQLFALLAAPPDAPVEAAASNHKHEAMIRLELENLRAEQRHESNIARCVAALRAGVKIDWPYSDLLDDLAAYHKAQVIIAAELEGK